MLGKGSQYIELSALREYQAYLLIGVGMLQSYRKDSQVALIDFAGGGNTQWFAILKFQSDNSKYCIIPDYFPSTAFGKDPATPD